MTSDDHQWREQQLGELAVDCRYGYTASATDERVGPKFLRITDIVGTLDWESVPFVDIHNDDVGKYHLRNGDVVIGRTGASVGVSAEVSNPPDAVFASYLVRFRFDPDKVAERFIGYVLKSPLWTTYVQGAHTGSGQPQLNASLMKEFRFAVPPIEEQRNIAWVLGSLDDKIENNRRTARTLEQIVATLFKARFVDFAGHNDLVDSELGPIPRGWDVTPVGEAVRVVGGSTPSTKKASYWDGGDHCWATPKDLSGHDSPILLDTNRHITDEGVQTISSKQLPAGTVLLSSRAPVGYTVISNVPISVNQGFIAIPPSKRIPCEYILFWLRQNLERIKANAGGTTFAEISKRAFRPIPMIVPPSGELDRFEAVVRPMFQRIAVLQEGITTLASIRDLLLPKLVSGTVRVSPNGQETA